jgi:hypothetical protein
MLTRFRRIADVLLFLVVSAALVCAISLAGLAISKNYNYCVGHNGQYDTGKQDDEGHAIIVPPVSQPSAMSVFLRCGGVYAERNSSALAAPATAFLVLIASLLGYLAWDQARTKRGELRAYVLVGDSIIGNIVPGGMPTAVMTIKNSGRTPAFKVRVFPGNPIFAPFTNADSLPPTVTSVPGSTQICGPGADFQMQANDPRLVLDREMIAQLESGTHAIFVQPQIHYRDAFGTKRVTRARMFVGGPTKLSRPHKEGPPWASRFVPGAYVLVGHDRGDDAT